MRIRQGIARPSLRALGPILAVCALLTLGASTTDHPTVAAAKSDKGGTSFGFSDEPVPWAEYVGWANRARASIGRVGVFHGVIDRYGWSEFDRAYRALRRHGIRPIMVLTGGRTQTMGKREWRALNRALARRYPSAAFQVLSETNHQGFGGRLTARRYARRAKQAERAIRSVRPKATVIASAAAPRATYRRPHRQAARYTRRVFRHIGRKRRIQAAAHIFPSSRRPVRQARRALLMVRRAARGRPVWVTETALRASHYGAGVRRARLSVRMLRALERRGAHAITFWRLIDDPLRAEREGALSVHGEPTPLYNFLRRARRR